MHAGPGAARRDHQPGRLVARHAARRSCGASIAGAQGRRYPREPVRRPRGRARSAGRPTSAPIASSCTPSRSRARSSRASAAGAASFDALRARRASSPHSLGLGVNAGHDLDLDNLVLFRSLPHLAEVSIGHALISHALFVGSTRASATIWMSWLIEHPDGEIRSGFGLQAPGSGLAFGPRPSTEPGA